MKKREASRDRLKYPLVQCEVHAGDALPGYVFCGHAGARLRERPTSTRLGVIACDDCDALSILGETDRARSSPAYVGACLCCVHCALERFAVPL
jgi:hypothetical protein